MEENDDKVFAFFSKLKVALKQYLDVDPERKILRGYIDNPPLVLYADKRLEILEILPKLNSAAAIGRIKLDREGAAQLKEVLEKANSGYLEELQEKHFHLVKEMDQLNLNTQDKSMLLKIEDVRYRLNHFSQQVEKIEQDVEKIEEEIRVRYLQQKKELGEFTAKIKELLGKNLEIKL
jgi:methyl-accepting chemotaxis protein